MMIRKSTLTLVLGLGLSLAFAGCSDDDKQSGKDSGPADQRVVDQQVDQQSKPDLPVKADQGTSQWPDTWVGKPCTSAANCSAGGAQAKCASGGDWVWPGGYCTQDCDPQNDQCPEGTHCEEFADTGKNPFYCIKNCKIKGTDCRDSEGYVCAVIPGVDYGGCVPF